MLDTPSRRHRLRHSLHAGRIVSTHALEGVFAAIGITVVAGVAIGFTLGYVGVKLVTIPINMVEAYQDPKGWLPPWNII